MGKRWKSSKRTPVTNCQSRFLTGTSISSKRMFKMGMGLDTSYPRFQQVRLQDSVQAVEYFCFLCQRHTVEMDDSHFWLTLCTFRKYDWLVGLLYGLNVCCECLFQMHDLWAAVQVGDDSPAGILVDFSRAFSLPQESAQVSEKLGAQPKHMPNATESKRQIHVVSG